MVTVHSDERGNLQPQLHELLFVINSKGFFYMHLPTYHGLCFTSCGTLVGIRNSSMGLPGEIYQTIQRYERTLYHQAMLTPLLRYCLTTVIPFISITHVHELLGVRCSSVVRAFAHGAMGHWIDPSWWTH